MDTWEAFLTGGDHPRQPPPDLHALLRLIASFGDGENAEQLRALLGSLRPEISAAVRRLAEPGDGPVGPLVAYEAATRRGRVGTRRRSPR